MVAHFLICVAVISVMGLGLYLHAKVVDPSPKKVLLALQNEGFGRMSCEYSGTPILYNGAWWISLHERQEEKKVSVFRRQPKTGRVGGRPEWVFTYGATDAVGAKIIRLTTKRLKQPY